MASWTSAYCILWICLFGGTDCFGYWSYLMCQVMHCIGVLAWRMIGRGTSLTLRMGMGVCLRHRYVLCHCSRMLLVANGAISCLPPRLQHHICVPECAVPNVSISAQCSICTWVCNAICVPDCAVPYLCTRLQCHISALDCAVTPSGINLVTFQFVVQCLNHYATTWATDALYRLEITWPLNH
jgi:hypothetical protein